MSCAYNIYSVTWSAIIHQNVLDVFWLVFWFTAVGSCWPWRWPWRTWRRWTPPLIVVYHCSDEIKFWWVIQWQGLWKLLLLLCNRKRKSLFVFWWMPVDHILVCCCIFGRNPTRRFFTIELVIRSINIHSHFSIAELSWLIKWVFLLLLWYHFRFLIHFPVEFMVQIFALLQITE